jgi:ABC-2 type transport system permease protein
MSPWRLERLRVWRTRRLIILAGVFVLLGLGSPVLTYYLPDIVKGSSGDGVRIIVPKQTAVDGLVGFASNLDPLATLVVMVVAAATMCVDANPTLSAFYRTRGLKLAPRYLTVTGATLAALVLGTLCAWYETAVLLGALRAADVLGGLALQALWFLLLIATITAFASLIRGVPGTVGASAGLLIVISAVPVLKSWLPTRLSTAVAALAQHQHHLWRPALTAALATVGLLALAVNRFAAREVQ